MAEFGVENPSAKLEFPDSPDHGDYTTNAAFSYAKALKMPPRKLSEEIVSRFKMQMPDTIAKIEIAGAGFINFHLKDGFVARQMTGVYRGRTSAEKIMVEYTDPNPFKVFHIGHLMANAIGESISRLVENSGAEVKRANWQGDVGPHVAKSLWGSKHIKNISGEAPDAFWGRAYVFGDRHYENPEKKKEIEDVNRKIYDRSDPRLNAEYEKGRDECLEAFEKIYARLGTKFDNYFFEGKEGRKGEAIVREYLDKGVFEKSEGAVVFKGERFGLHTRVFITSQGLPTYETKELGLNKEKFNIYPDLSKSIIVTANEQSDYFRVLLKAMELVYPEIAKKTKHIAHGLLRFASGKMSSRKGNVISADELIGDIKDLVLEKIVNRNYSEAEAEEISEIVAIGAIKYTILRSSIGSDIIFDSAASISFEGDSGPYLQYSAVRAASVLEKAELLVGEVVRAESAIRNNGNDSSVKVNESPIKLPEKVGYLERLLIRFDYVISRATNEYAPQAVANYLLNLAGEFNSFYGRQTIVDKENALSPYYLAVTKKFYETMTKGLWLLGIKVPRKM